MEKTTGASELCTCQVSNVVDSSLTFASVQSLDATIKVEEDIEAPDDDEFDDDDDDEGDTDDDDEDDDE